MKKVIIGAVILFVCAVIFLKNTPSVEPDSSDTTQTTVTTTTKPSNSESNSNSYSYSRPSKQRVTCWRCNGTGKVKYYYGSSATEAYLSGHNDYEYGPCSKCKGTGYIYE